MPETRRSFDEQQQEIHAEVVKLAAKACEQIGAATQALLDADLPLVEQIYATHHEIEASCCTSSSRCTSCSRCSSRWRPTSARCSRSCASCTRSSSPPGLMRNVARATRRLYPRELPPRIRGIIERMGAQASVQTRLAVDAFTDEDVVVATALPDMDDVMDDLQKELFRAIFAGLRRARSTRPRSRWRCSSRSSDATTSGPPTTP